MNDPARAGDMRSWIYRPVRQHRGLASAVLAVLAIAALDGDGVRAREGSTRGFLITDSRLAMHYGPMESDCPDGFDPTVEELFLRTLSQEDQALILLPENAEEYANAWKFDFIMGPGGENVCQNPKSFGDDPRHPPHRGIQSTVAYGLNLDGTADGRATPLTCAHPKFEGLNGEPAVDNQLYRAVGCYKSARGTAESEQQGPRFDPFLIELRGLDDPQNDDRVEVGIYTIPQDDLILQSAGGEALPYQSFRVTSNPTWRTETTGRVVNGELLTDTVDRMFLRNVMPNMGHFGQVSAHEIRRVRLRLQLEADGGVTGLLGGYRPLLNVNPNQYCCRGTASTANMNCASEYKTFAMMADGDPDPETGQCTTISAAHELIGVPAFVVHDARSN